MTPNESETVVLELLNGDLHLHTVYKTTDYVQVPVFTSNGFGVYLLYRTGRRDRHGNVIFSARTSA